MIINNAPNHHIQPWDIKTERLFVGAFGNHKMEYTARLIIIHCKMMEEWRSFTEQTIKERFPDEVMSGNYNLDLLAKKGFIVKVDHAYCVTTEFVERCYKASITPRGS